MLRLPWVKGSRLLVSATAASAFVCLSNPALGSTIAGPGDISTMAIQLPAQRYIGTESIAPLQTPPGGTALVSDQLCTPGLTVAPTVTDRHAAHDVGGRLDVTKSWRLTIPDPVNGNSQYRNLTGAKASATPEAAPAADSVTPCLDRLPEIATGSQSALPVSLAMGGGRFPNSRSLWWGSSLLALASLPAGSSVITSGFGLRRHPILQTVREHVGVDLAAPVGTPVFATQNGVVRMASRYGGYGLLVDLDHGAGLATRYGHMSRLSVVAGQRVRKGQIVGFVGSTGRSTGPHLHYEVRVNGQAVNPLMKRRK